MQRMKTFVFLLVTLQVLSPTLNAPLKDSAEVAELGDAELEPPHDGVHDHEDPGREGKWTFNFNPGAISISDHSFAGEYETLSVGHYANVENIEGNQITENEENVENVESLGGDKITETNENVGNVNNVENVETASGLSAAGTSSSAAATTTTTTAAATTKTTTAAATTITTTAAATTITTTTAATTITTTAAATTITTTAAATTITTTAAATTITTTTTAAATTATTTAATTTATTTVATTTATTTAAATTATTTAAATTTTTAATTTIAVDGGWSNWGEYGQCSKECGGGKQTRTRTCTNPVPQHGGRTCQQQHIGDNTETKDCNLHVCVWVFSPTKSTSCDTVCDQIGKKCDREQIKTATVDSSCSTLLELFPGKTCTLCSPADATNTFCFPGNPSEPESHTSTVYYHTSFSSSSYTCQTIPDTRINGVCPCK